MISIFFSFLFLSMKSPDLYSKYNWKVVSLGEVWKSQEVSKKYYMNLKMLELREAPYGI